MIPLRIKRTRFSRAETLLLPSSYGELTLDQFLGYHRHADKPSELLAYLTGTEYILPESQITAFLYWLAEPLDVNQFKPETYEIDLKQKTLGQKIQAHLKLKENNTMYGVEAVLKVYYPESEPLKMQLSEALPKYFGIVEQLAEILRVEAGTLDKAPSAEQLRAGVEEFAKLGDFNTYDDLAQGDPTKYDAVLDLPYIVCYQKLLKNKISAKFTERYNQILREQ